MGGAARHRFDQNRLIGSPDGLNLGSAEVVAYRRLLTADALRLRAVDLLRKGAFGFAVLSFGRWWWRKPQLLPRGILLATSEVRNPGGRGVSFE